MSGVSLSPVTVTVTVTRMTSLAHHWEVGNDSPPPVPNAPGANGIFDCLSMAGIYVAALVGFATIAAKITRAARRTVRG